MIEKKSRRSVCANVCNSRSEQSMQREKRRKERKTEKLWQQHRPSTSETDRESRVCEHAKRTCFIFFLMLVLLSYSAFVPFSLGRTFLS